MEISRRYAEPSSSALSAASAKFSLATDVNRPGVFLDANVLHSTQFARAMLVMHQVVCSNLVARTKDHSAYQAWVQGEYLKELESTYSEYLRHIPVLQKSAQDVTDKIMKVWREINDNPLNIEDKNYRDSRQKFWSWLYGVNRQAWIVIDPVVSVQPDCVLFEGFSLDESTYARITLPDSSLDHRIEKQRGTTNINFGEQLAREFARVRTYRSLRLQVGTAQVAVSTDAGSAIENKIDLPDTWVKGFLEVQSAAALTKTLLKLSSGTVADVIDQLMRKREKHGPRSLKFHLQPGSLPIIEIEPWNIRIEEPVYKYAGVSEQIIRIWGRRRLLFLRDILPDFDQVEVRFLGSGMPSFWTLCSDTIQIELGLSGWISNDWASKAKFEQMAAVGSVDDQALTRLAGALKGSPSLSVLQAAEDTGLDRATANKGLQRLCARGLAMFDAHFNVYRWRELFAPGIADSASLSSAERHSAQSLLEAANVTITAVKSVERDKVRIESRVEERGDLPYQVTVDVDLDGRASNPSCTCYTFRKFGLTKGPCSHLRATLILSDQHINKGSFNGS